MKLSVIDRFTLLNVLPKEGNYLTLRIIRDLQSELSFSEDELREMNFKEESGAATWNEIEKEINIGEKANDVIIGALKKADKESKLTIEMIDTYGKFIEVG
jgi:hypothetical protein